MSRAGCSHRRVGAPRGRIGGQGTGASQPQRLQLLAAAIGQSAGCARAGPEEEIETAARGSAGPSTASAATTAAGAGEPNDSVAAGSLPALSDAVATHSGSGRPCSQPASGGRTAGADGCY